MRNPQLSIGNRQSAIGNRPSQSAIANPHLSIVNCQLSIRRSRGLTLVEVLVTLGIFVFLASMLMALAGEVVRTWTRNERDRILYERAGGALDRVSGDLSLALGVEPAGVDSVKVRFIGDEDPATRVPRVMFVRSFESGPERALTLQAGDGKHTDLRFRPKGEDGEDAPRKRTGGPDKDIFTGQALGDYKALGGMAQVAYFVSNQVFYRAIRAPVPEDGRFSDILATAAATPLIEDVLHFDLDYWSQYTQSWDPQPAQARAKGPQRVWDSTRGVTADALRNFILHRGSESLNDPEDDVFPEKVRVTLCVDSPLPRCVNTKLIQDTGAGETHILVDSTRGFPPAGGEDSFILIDKEWIHYRDKTEDTFIADQRGARGTEDAEHRENAVVRTGKTFRRVIHLRLFREDWSSDQEFFERKKRQRLGPTRVLPR